MRAAGRASGRSSLDLKAILDHVTGDPLLVRLGIVIVVIIATVIAIWTLQSIVGRNVSDKNVRYRVRKTISFVGYLVAAVIAIGAFSDSWGQVTVFFGVAGAGIAFALQEVIVSVAGWAALSFGAFYRPGDRVKLGGIDGDVIDVGVVRTTLMETGEWVAGDLYNGRVVRVANSFAFKAPVIDYSADFPFLWDELEIPIRYGSDWKAAEANFEQAATSVTTKLAERSTEEWERFVKKYLVEKIRVAPLITLVTTGDWRLDRVHHPLHY